MLLLVDLDGVVYRGTEPIAGMPELLTRRAAAGDIIVYVTNNSRWHRSEYAARLRSMGAPVADDRILTSGRGTALALAGRDRPPRLCLVFGGPGLVRELHDVGLATVEASDAGRRGGPDTVVCGVDFELSFERLSAAAMAVRDGAFFVATNRDPVLPMPDGLKAGAGATVAAVAAAAGREPDLVIGKPEPGLMLEAAASVGLPAQEAVIIGDGLLTDIAAANAVGARSVLVLTGVSTLEQAQAQPPERRPTAVAADVAELEAILEGLASAAAA